jgi:hypothetical protein
LVIHSISIVVRRPLQHPAMYSAVGAAFRPPWMAAMMVPKS